MYKNTDFRDSTKLLFYYYIILLLTSGQLYVILFLMIELCLVDSLILIGDNMPLSKLDRILISKDRKIRFMNRHTRRPIQQFEIRPNELIEFLWACIDHADITKDFDISIKLYKRIARITLETNREKIRQDKRRLDDRINKSRLRFYHL